MLTRDKNWPNADCAFAFSVLIIFKQFNLLSFIQIRCTHHTFWRKSRPTMKEAFDINKLRINDLLVPTWLICWLVNFLIVDQPCNCTGFPQCYICNSTSQRECERDKQLVTCPNTDVSCNFQRINNFISLMTWTSWAQKFARHKMSFTVCCVLHYGWRRIADILTLQRNCS